MVSGLLVGLKEVVVSTTYIIPPYFAGTSQLQIFRPGSELGIMNIWGLARNYLQCLFPPSHGSQLTAHSSQRLCFFSVGHSS